MEKEIIISQFNKNNEEHKTIMEKIEKFSDKLDDISITIARLPDDIFERADKRYASKTSEKIIYGMVGVVCTGVVVALLGLVILK